MNGDRFARAIELNLNFRRIKFDGAAFCTAGADFLGEGKQCRKLLMHRTGTCIEHTLRLFIGEALV